MGFLSLQLRILAWKFCRERDLSTSATWALVVVVPQCTRRRGRRSVHCSGGRRPGWRKLFLSRVWTRPGSGLGDEAHSISCFFSGNLHLTFWLQQEGNRLCHVCVALGSVWSGRPGFVQAASSPWQWQCHRVKTTDFVRFSRCVAANGLLGVFFGTSSVTVICVRCHFRTQRPGEHGVDGQVETRVCGHLAHWSLDPREPAPPPPMPRILSVLLLSITRTRHVLFILFCA